MEEMKKKGIDPATADQSAIKKYLKDHPEALKAARDEIRKNRNAVSGATSQEVNAMAQTEAQRTAAAAPSPATRGKGSKATITAKP